MNKRATRVNFSPKLITLVKKGIKDLTWRINDEKNFQVGDELILWMKGKNELGEQTEASKPFGKALVTEVWEKQFKDFSKKEKDGHEKFETDEEMIGQYKKYYGDWVSMNTIVKIIRFKLL